MKWTTVTPDGFEKLLKGAVMPYVPSCRAYKTALQAIPTSTWTAINLDAERFDTDGMHDTVTNNTRLTCRTAGKYLLVGHASWVAVAGTRRLIGIWLNGMGTGVCVARMDLSGAAGEAGSEMGPVVATIWDLAVGDYVELGAYQTTGSPLNIVAGSAYSPEFMASYLGPGIMGSAGNVQYVSSLPASAPHGTEVVLVVDAANGINWRMKFNAYSASGYKWEFIGGPPLGAFISTDETITGDSTWRDPATVGPTIVAPRAGEFLINAAMSTYNTSGASAGQYLGVAIGATTPALPFEAVTAVPAANQGYWCSIVPTTGLVAAAGDSIRLRYMGVAGVMRVSWRSLSVTPKRLS